MLIARWQIDAKFGDKQTVLDLMNKWLREVGTQAGTDALNVQILTGSIGSREATIEMNHQIESLEQLEKVFAAISKIDAHKKWGKEMEPHVVSGSSRWTIYRVVPQS